MNSRRNETNNRPHQGLVAFAPCGGALVIPMSLAYAEGLEPWSPRGSVVHSGRRKRVGAPPSKLCQQRPGNRKVPGLCFWSLHSLNQARASAQAVPPAMAELFNKLPQGSRGTGRGLALHLCGCSSAGRARPCHGRGHEFETRHPLHFGCAPALHERMRVCACGVGCARPWPGFVQRDHIRPDARAAGTAEVDSFFRPRSSAGRAAAL